MSICRKLLLTSTDPRSSPIRLYSENQHIPVFYQCFKRGRVFNIKYIVVRNKISCEVYIIIMFLLKTRSVLTYQIKYQVISIYCYYKTL